MLMRMHRYGGRENGLAIIGSVDELVGLGRVLIEADTALANARVPASMWPPLVAEFKPMSNSGQFKPDRAICQASSLPPCPLPTIRTSDRSG